MNTAKLITAIATFSFVIIASTAHAKEGFNPQDYELSEMPFPNSSLTGERTKVDYEEGRNVDTLILMECITPKCIIQDVKPKYSEALRKGAIDGEYFLTYLHRENILIVRTKPMAYGVAISYIASNCEERCEVHVTVFMKKTDVQKAGGMKKIHEIFG